MSRRLILFAHGSRDPVWATTLNTLAGMIEAKDPSIQVRCAFLEHLSPNLPDSIDTLAASVSALDICPIFWAANGHVQRDLPGLVTEARRRHPALDLKLHPVLSELPGLLDFLADTLIAQRG